MTACHRLEKRVPIERASQQGAALIMGLVILLVLTILGVTALRTSSMQQLMAGNIQESTRAFVIADSALDWVFIGDLSTTPQDRMANFRQISSDSAPAFITLPTYSVTSQTGLVQTDIFRASATIYRTIKVQTTNNFSNRSENSSGGSTGFAFLDQVAISFSGTSLAIATAQDIKQQGIRQKTPGATGENFSSSADQ